MNVIPFSPADSYPLLFTEEMAWNLHFKIADDVYETIPFTTEIHPDMFVYFHFGTISEERLNELEQWFVSKLLNDIKWITTSCKSGVISSLQINFKNNENQ